MSKRPNKSVRTPILSNILRNPRLIVSLLFLGILAIAFPLMVIQVQAGVTAYLAGESSWSRGQVETVFHAHSYARSGDARHLVQIQQSIDIPIGDRVARQAMEREQPNYNLAREGFLRGKNHPDDITRMIWLFRIFQSAPYFKEAIEAWRDSDTSIAELEEVIQVMQVAWEMGTYK